MNNQNVPDHLKKYLSTNYEDNNNNSLEKKKKKKKKPSVKELVLSGPIIKDIDDENQKFNHYNTHLNTNSFNEVTQDDNDDIDKDSKEDIPAIENLSQFNHLSQSELNNLLNSSKTNKKKSISTGTWVSINDDSTILSSTIKNDDLSPPRNRNRNEDTSPPRNRNRNEDTSPPRKRDLSPPRNRNRNEDISPPRNRNRNEDISPPRNRNRNQDISPPRKRDLSPPRNKNDLSPPRKRDLSPPRNRISRDGSNDNDNDNYDDKPKTMDANKRLKMSFGAEAGLHTGSAIKEQALKRAKEQKESFQKADEGLLGKNATTVYRDKHGRKLDDIQIQNENEQKQQQNQFEWGNSGGYVQKEKKDELLKRIEEEKSKPFSRFSNDDDMNIKLKNKDIWGDPMAYKKSSSSSSSNNNNNNSNQITKPMYKGPYPPNRYGIAPGHRWDGVDRSNGFESKLIQKQNEMKNRSEEAYYWSVEDM